MTKLEFIKDSPELEEFVKTLKPITWDNFEGDYDDYHTFNQIYLQESSGKHFSAEMKRHGGIYSKPKFIAYRRNFKSSEPYVVTFIEVEPIEVVRTEWREV